MSSSTVAATTVQELHLEALDKLGELLDILLLRQYYLWKIHNHQSG
jgi:hypothetical protein